MSDEHEVSLREAEPGDAVTLANLLELYLHDLSESFSIDVGVDGRFGYERLPLYFQEPERRSAHLIWVGARLAGFVLATRGSPLTNDPDQLDVAEFFVLRRYRRARVGRRAAFLLWDNLPGSWVVRVADTNRGALPFWRAVISEYAGHEWTERAVPLPGRGWRVFEFKSRVS
jgi:predicted acetyltransferase